MIKEDLFYIHISHECIKLFILSKSNVIKNFEIVPLPLGIIDKGYLINHKYILSIIKKYRKKHFCYVKKVVAVLNIDAIYRFATMRYLDEETLAKTLKQGPSIATDSQDYHIDYQVLEIEDNIARTFSVIIKSDLLGSYLKLFDEMKIDIVDIYPRFLATYIGAFDKGIILVITRYLDKNILIIVKNGQLQTSETLLKTNEGMILSKLSLNGSEAIQRAYVDGTINKKLLSSLIENNIELIKVTDDFIKNSENIFEKDIYWNFSYKYKNPVGNLIKIGAVAMLLLAIAFLYFYHISESMANMITLSNQINVVESVYERNLQNLIDLELNKELLAFFEEIPMRQKVTNQMLPHVLVDINNRMIQSSIEPGRFETNAGYFDIADNITASRLIITGTGYYRNIREYIQVLDIMEEFVIVDRILLLYQGHNLFYAEFSLLILMDIDY